MTTPVHTTNSTSANLIGDNVASEVVTSAYQWLEDLTARWGFVDPWTEVTALVLVVLGVIAVCIIANYLGKAFIRGLAHHPLRKSSAPWAKAVMKQQVLVRLSHLLPVAILAIALPAFTDYGVDWWLRPLLEVYVIWVLLRVAFGLLEVGEVLVLQHGLQNRIPAVGLSQAGKLILSIIAIVLVMSVLFTKSPLWFLSGLGAVAAVMMLIFKDSILGLVAGIQVTVNDMVRVGDWITIPSKGVDGDVEEITLTTIRVRAFDKTVSLVPAYDIVSNPFTNWRAMSESGGRRIKRAINIDISTVRFVNAADLARYRKFTILQDYLDAKLAELDGWNAQHEVAREERINGRQQTNVGVFRAYIEAYLHHHPKIHSKNDFTFLIRHLNPTPTGLPIELYVFTNDNNWVPYERIQADIFDHLLAAVPEFDLSVFQTPSGRDLRMLAGTHETSAPAEGPGILPTHE
jgi:miniconductance mechanosensitive channel